MTGRKVLTVILTGIMIFAMFAVTGCQDKMPEYENIVQAIDTYRTNYSEYRKAGDENMVTYNSDSLTTPEGITCRSYYVASSNGLFKSVTLEYDKNDTMMVDEYFYLTDNAFFVVNSYIDAETLTPVISRYYVWKGTMYMIDEENKAITEADDATVARFYTSFDQLTEVYGPQG